MPIILQFSTQKNFASKILHWFDHVWCSHVDAVMDNPENENHYLLGAKLLGGVCFRPNEGFTKTLMVEIPCFYEQQLGFERFLREQIGKPYDLNGIYSFMINRDWREDDSWYCSELMAAGLEKCGLLRYPLYTKQVTPQNLLLLCNTFTKIGEPTIITEK